VSKQHQTRSEAVDAIRICLRLAGVDRRRAPKKTRQSRRRAGPWHRLGRRQRRPPLQLRSLARASAGRHAKRSARRHRPSSTRWPPARRVPLQSSRNSPHHRGVAPSLVHCECVRSRDNGHAVVPRAARPRRGIEGHRTFQRTSRAPTATRGRSQPFARANRARLTCRFATTSRSSPRGSKDGVGGRGAWGGVRASCYAADCAKANRCDAQRCVQVACVAARGQSRSDLLYRCDD
jgi:hypothetical protein